MDETIGQIEDEIDRSRAHLGAHLRELEERVDAATDWREYVRARPYAAVAVAVAAGLAVGKLIGHRRHERAFSRAAATTPKSAPQRSIDASGKAYELWENVANTILALAAGRLTDYIGTLVPGFTEEFRRVEARGSDPSRTMTASDAGLA